MRLKNKSRSKVLLVEDLNRAEEQVLEILQRESFLELFSEKQSFGKTKKGGILSKFAPFFDGTGVIRNRGRIKHAHLSFEQRHPVLSSTKQEMVITMLRDLHLEHNHEGVEYVRSVIQQKFWIIGLKDALSSIKLVLYSFAKYVHRIKHRSWPTYPQRDLTFNNIRVPTLGWIISFRMK